MCQYLVVYQNYYRTVVAYHLALTYVWTYERKLVELVSELVSTTSLSTKTFLISFKSSTRQMFQHHWSKPDHKKLELIFMRWALITIEPIQQWIDSLCHPEYIW